MPICVKTGLGFAFLCDRGTVRLSGWLRRLSPERFRPLFRRVKSIEVKSWVALRKRPYEPVLEAALHEMQTVRNCTLRPIATSRTS